MWQFPDCPMIRTYTVTARSQVQFLARELRSLKQCIKTNNNNIIKKKKKGFSLDQKSD